MNRLLAEGGYLLGVVRDAHAHQEAVGGLNVLALLQLLVHRVKLEHAAEVLEAACLLVVGLPSNNEDAVLVPGEVNGDEVGEEGELLVGLKLDRVPTIALEGVALDAVEAL